MNNNEFAEETFYLDVIDGPVDCSTAVIDLPSFVYPAYEYAVSSPAKFIQIEQATVTPSDCELQYQLVDMGGYTFNQYIHTMVTEPDIGFNVFTNDDGRIGTYTVKVRIRLVDYSSIYKDSNTFSLVIKSKCYAEINTTPYPNIVYNIGEGNPLKYYFPSWSQ